MKGSGDRGGWLDPTSPLRFLPPVAWMGLIYLVSDRPDIPSVPAPVWDLLLKKSLHALAYAILLGLWWWALKPSSDGPESHAGRAGGEAPGPAVAIRNVGGSYRNRHPHHERALIASLLITLAWAASDEWHQTFVPGRSGRIRDVFIDGVGAAMAAAWIHRGPASRKPVLSSPRSPGARPSRASGSGDPPA